MGYKFCMTAFQSNPRSRTTDLEGLGTISMQLTMALAKKTEAHIKWLMESGRFDGYDRDCWDVCLELYTDLKSTLRHTLRALEEESYRDANVWVGAVVDVAVTCEDGFKERGDYKSPLKKENDYPLTKENDYPLTSTWKLAENQSLGIL
ncbi:hypothetical protein MRB53_020934 [Persea americana]|uniref:Uncharacterized protein n=1 Tax=Persea americana TaxID=3435 RepID=A0ACC2L2B3_PERAE|nr:hypothetical protein MRB53_020934 [Persea americana]